MRSAWLILVFLCFTGISFADDSSATVFTTEEPTATTASETSEAVESSPTLQFAFEIAYSGCEAASSTSEDCLASAYRAATGGMVSVEPNASFESNPTFTSSDPLLASEPAPTDSADSGE